MLEPSHFQQGVGPAVSEMLWQLAKVAGPEDMEVSGRSWDGATPRMGVGRHNVHNGRNGQT